MHVLWYLVDHSLSYILVIYDLLKGNKNLLLELNIGMAKKDKFIFLRSPFFPNRWKKILRKQT